MEKEFEYFLSSGRQWWCHFDDDNFVNVLALGQMLQKYDSDKPWYLGKTSTASPLKIMTMDRKVMGFVFDKNNWRVKPEFSRTPHSGLLLVGQDSVFPGL